MHRPTRLCVAFGALAFCALTLGATAPSHAATTPARQIGVSCVRDEAIPAAQRQLLAAQALAFLDDLVAGRTHQAYLLLSPLARRTASEAALAGVARGVQAGGPFSSRQVAHTYLLQASAAGSRVIELPCAPEPGGRASVAAGPDLREAHLLIALARPGGNAWLFTVWLGSSGGPWAVNGFHYGASRMAGFSGADLWLRAKAERARGHRYNATFLYHLAAVLMSSGPYVRLPAEAAFEADRAGFIGPAELVGRPPLTLTLGAERFVLDEADIIVIQRPPALGLSFSLRPPLGATPAQGDQQNRRLIDAYIKAHPEWADAFDGLVARTGQGAGTTYLKGQGYLAAPAP